MTQAPWIRLRGDHPVHASRVAVLFGEMLLLPQLPAALWLKRIEFFDDVGQKQ